ncbi:MAG: ASCH domain-containing protein [Planctomycetota bacterium]
MNVHVAILRKPYLDAVLAGTKTIESRLTRTAKEPYGSIAAGERLFLKQSGGPFRATAIAVGVEQFGGLRPSDVEGLRRRFQARVGGDHAYWRDKRDARFAVFVTLGAVESLSAGPSYAVQSMRAWYTLPGSVSPLHETVLTSGAIRNRYAALPGVSERLRGSRLTLVLPDGREVSTEFAAGSRLRWRGWGEVYAAAGVSPGDRVRYVALGDDRFAVSFPGKAS